MTHEPATALVRIEGVSKAYGGVRALESVSFDLRAGEIHALCGENGAGKSTLNKLLSGSISPDSGSIRLGDEVVPASVRDAESMGIAFVHQESIAFPDLDAVDNIFLLREVGPFWLDKARMRREAIEVLRSLGEEFPVDVPLARLSLAQRQIVGIARALVLQCRVLILDEPTGSLSARESKALFAAIRMLRERGVAILFVSHRLDEVFELADRVTVLRDGRHVITAPAADLDHAELIRLMVGRDVHAQAPDPAKVGEPLLVLEDLNGVSLTVSRGEVVTLAGLVGAGRSELVRALFGVDPPVSGRALIDGKSAPVLDPKGVISLGVAFVPEDRQHEGLHLPMSLRENIAMVSTMDRRWTSHASERAQASACIDELGIRTSGVEESAHSLSGGNQQKVVLAKWLATKPRLLILDEPTRGVDVGAKAEIHALVRELAKQGSAVLVISSDLPEVLALSDRIVVLRQGKAAGELSAADATQEAVLTLALPEETARGAHESRLRKPLPKEVPIALVLIMSVIACTIVNPAFLSVENLRDLLVRVSPAVIVGSGLTLVVIAREIDISMGSLMGTCAALLGLAGSTDRLNLPASVAVAVCLGAGLIGGLLNGLLVGIGKIPSIIVTLGMLTVLQGVTELLLGGTWITQMPGSLRAFGTGSVAGVPHVVGAAVLVALLCTWLGTRTAFGRRVYAIGSNPGAASSIGVPTNRIRLALFTLVGFLSGLAALFSATQLQVVESGFGRGFELTVVAAVVVGGTSIRGGRGSILGTALGAALLGSVGTMLIFLKLGESSVYWERAIGGAVILVAIVADHVSRRRGGVE